MNGKMNETMKSSYKKFDREYDFLYCHAKIYLYLLDDFNIQLWFLYILI